MRVQISIAKVYWCFLKICRTMSSGLYAFALKRVHGEKREIMSNVVELFAYQIPFSCM